MNEFLMSLATNIVPVVAIAILIKIKMREARRCPCNDPRLGRLGEDV
jgi:hypothetical protein